MAEVKSDPRRSLIETYIACIQSKGIAAHEHPHHAHPKTSGERLAHAHALLRDLLRHLDEWKPGKVDRKLAFIEGILWSERLYTQSMIRAHRRSLEPPS